MHGRRFVGLLLGAGVGSAPAGAAVLRFSTVATGLDEPVALAALPDGRLLVGQRGAIYSLRDGEIDPTPVAQLNVYAFSECGLLGITADPAFTSNGFLYVFATVSPDEQQIIRLTVGPAGATVPYVVRGNLPTNGSVHNGGAISFGLDGMLYFAVGDTGNGEAAQVMHTLAGKVCRIRPDGTVPADNPFKTPTGTPRAVWALGFRNPFRLAFASDGRLMVGDVGSSGDGRAEEINIIEAGRNYGWPRVEGSVATTSSEFAPPALAYHAEGASIAGAAFIGDDLYHLDFASGGVFRAATAGLKIVAHEQVAQIDGGPVDLVAAGGGLYACTFLDGAVLYAHVAGAGDVTVAAGPPPGGGASNRDRMPCGNGLPAAAGLLLAALSVVRCLAVT